jgi:ACT domain-containing protein
METNNLQLEFHSEGDQASEISENLKAYVEESFSEISSIEIYKVKNLGFGESVLVVVIGQIVGHIVRTIIDKILEKKNDNKNKEIVITLKFVPVGKQFQLPNELSQARQFLEENEQK